MLPHILRLNLKIKNTTEPPRIPAPYGSARPPEHVASWVRLRVPPGPRKSTRKDRKTMRKWMVVVGVAAAVGLQAQAQSPEGTLVERAADALGGRERVLSVRTLTIHGYGQLASQNGGGNIVASPQAPMKWTNIVGHVRAIDFSNNRMHMQQVQMQDFVFAYARNMRGEVRTHQGLDGDVAYSVAADGQISRAGGVRGRRLQMLDNPLSLVRAALDPSARVSNLRTEDTDRVMDLLTAQGDAVTFALDATTNLPTWMSWVEGNTNLGDLRLRTYYVGYQDEQGLRLPAGYNTVIDFRDVVQRRFYVDKYEVDTDVGDLSAPADVRAATPGGGGNVNIEVVPVADGIWYLRGRGNSTLFEFEDHLTLFEVYASEANAMAMFEAARRTVPGKPLTEVIVSHHHFDHSGGLRAAIAEGLTIITQRGNVELFRELAMRPAVAFPDALGRNPRPLRIRPVDDMLVLRDDAMEVHVYRAISNSHMASAVIAWAPEARVIAEGDMVDENWDLVWWGNSYPATVEYWNLDVERDLPVHGDINTYEDVLTLLREQTANAEALCRHVAESGLAMVGCPVSNTGF